MNTQCYNSGENGVTFFHNLETVKSITTDNEDIGSRKKAHKEHAKESTCLIKGDPFYQAQTFLLSENSCVLDLKAASFNQEIYALLTTFWRG
ncbi:hypothetical protein L345_06149, partial [Ophiophagus hannah]